MVIHDRRRKQVGILEYILYTLPLEWFVDSKKVLFVFGIFDSVFLFSVFLFFRSFGFGLFVFGLSVSVFSRDTLPSPHLINMEIKGALLRVKVFIAEF